jgi:hypothetical protein
MKTPTFTGKLCIFDCCIIHPVSAQEETGLGAAAGDPR